MQADYTTPRQYAAGDIEHSHYEQHKRFTYRLGVGYSTHRVVIICRVIPEASACIAMRG